jgi:hypothetical protein
MLHFRIEQGTSNHHGYCPLVVLTVCVVTRIDADTSSLSRFLPLLAFLPRPLAFCFELVATTAKLSDRLLSQKLFERPLFDILGLVLLELSDELYSSCENAALVLLTTRNDLGELVDTLVDGLTTSTFNCRKVNGMDGCP